jgi:hypothetical protein
MLLNLMHRAIRINTFLHPDGYTPYFLSREQLVSKAHQQPGPTFSYRANKQLWSITPKFPINSLHGLPVKWVNLTSRKAYHEIMCVIRNPKQVDITLIEGVEHEWGCNWPLIVVMVTFTDTQEEGKGKHAAVLALLANKYIRLSVC